MADSMRANLPPNHPQMLRAKGEGSPQPVGIAFLKTHGDALEWALDRCRIEQKDAAYRMGYTDSGVVSRWISGLERMQLDKLRGGLGEKFFGELLVALLQTCEEVEVKTQVTLGRTA